MRAVLKIGQRIDFLLQWVQENNRKRSSWGAIVDYIAFPNKKAYKSEHGTLDRQTGENDLDQIFFSFVKLPKSKKLLKQVAYVSISYCMIFYYICEANGFTILYIIHCCSFRRSMCIFYSHTPAKHL